MLIFHTEKNCGNLPHRQQCGFCTKTKLCSSAHRQKCGHLLTERRKKWSYDHRQKCGHLLTDFVNYMFRKLHCCNFYNVFLLRPVCRMGGLVKALDSSCRGVARHVYDTRPTATHLPGPPGSFQGLEHAPTGFALNPKTEDYQI